MKTFSALSVNSPHKRRWRGVLMFSLICAWINDWVNNRDAGDWRHHRAHYDGTVMGMAKKRLAKRKSWNESYHSTQLFGWLGDDHSVCAFIGVHSWHGHPKHCGLRDDILIKLWYEYSMWNCILSTPIYCHHFEYPKRCVLWDDTLITCGKIWRGTPHNVSIPWFIHTQTYWRTFQ